MCISWQFLNKHVVWLLCSVLRLVSSYVTRIPISQSVVAGAGWRDKAGIMNHSYIRRRRRHNGWKRSLGPAVGGIFTVRLMCPGTPDTTTELWLFLFYSYQIANRSLLLFVRTVICGFQSLLPAYYVFALVRFDWNIPPRVLSAPYWIYIFRRLNDAIWNSFPNEIGSWKLRSSSQVARLIWRINLRKREHCFSHVDSRDLSLWLGWIIGVLQFDKLNPSPLLIPVQDSEVFTFQMLALNWNRADYSFLPILR